MSRRKREAYAPAVYVARYGGKLYAWFDWDGPIGCWCKLPSKYDGESDRSVVERLVANFPCVSSHTTRPAVDEHTTIIRTEEPRSPFDDPRREGYGKKPPASEGRGLPCHRT